MKRLETETFEDYKVRRAEANLELKMKLRKRLIWDGSTQGTKKGKFKKYSVEELQEILDTPPVVEPVVAEEVKEEEVKTEEETISNGMTMFPGEPA